MRELVLERNVGKNRGEEEGDGGKEEVDVGESRKVVEGRR